MKIDVNVFNKCNEYIYNRTALSHYYYQLQHLQAFNVRINYTQVGISDKRLPPILTHLTRLTNAINYKGLHLLTTHFFYNIYLSFINIKIKCIKV